MNLICDCGKELVPKVSCETTSPFLDEKDLTSTMLCSICEICGNIYNVIRQTVSLPQVSSPPAAVSPPEGDWGYLREGEYLILKGWSRFQYPNSYTKRIKDKRYVILREKNKTRWMLFYYGAEGEDKQVWYDSSWDVYFKTLLAELKSITGDTNEL